tara:strand:+ start:9843 stop:10652 length:810 start_codon:yes stop_codon:yes gene_type:complete
MKASVILFISFILTISNAYAQVIVGEDAPDFSLQVLGESQGTKISLSELNGKVVYLFFYGAGCPHCLSNGPVTETEIHQSFIEDTNFVALGLDTWDYSVSANNSFRNQTGITYELLLQAKQTLVNYYGGSQFYDRSVVIGADAKLKYKGTGYVSSDYETVIEVIETELSTLVTSSEDEQVFPSTLKLEQNYPNPFNPSTTISYQLATPAQVKLQVFNLLGKEVATLVNGFQTSGGQSVTWNASQVPSGIYMYRITAGDAVSTKRMMLIK